MKKVLFLMVAVLALGLVFAGCSGGIANITAPGTTQEGIVTLSRGDDPEIPLKAGQDILVGEVIVTDDGENLCVQYQLSDDAIADGWGIYETHLAVATSIDGIPANKTGNPIPGHFPYGDDELAGVEMWPEKPLCISLEDIEGAACDEELYIAAHAVVKRIIPDCWETVWQIGDVETQSCEGNLTNYADEFNWAGATECTTGLSLVEDEPEFANPFIVETTPTSEFPYNSNYDRGYATDFDVEWDGELPFGGTLTVSWSPGQSAAEKKVVSDVFGTVELTATGSPEAGKGWFMDKYPLVKDVITVDPVEMGIHTINFKHTQGDGTFWDWIRLEKPCIQEETAWGGVDRLLNQGNWATYFTYIVPCPCVEQLWQIGTPDGAVDPIQGAAEYPATEAWTASYDYYIGDDSDPINAPSMPGYIGSVNVCEIDPNRPCTDTTMRLNIQFELNCAHEEGDLILFYDRYGSETDTLYFDFDGEPFATVVATEGGFKQFTLPLPASAAGTHTISIAYEGGGDANGHYIDYLKLVEAP